MTGLIDHGVIAMALYVLNSTAETLPYSLNINGIVGLTQAITRPLRTCCITINDSKNLRPNV